MVYAPCTFEETLESRIAPLRLQLAQHPLYLKIQTPGDLCIFLEHHVFAVWDFMSLLKSLQARLTSVGIPWTPSRWPDSRRFINEIVLGEESDLFEGRAVSHFELYREAMDEAGADTCAIDELMRLLASGSAFSPERMAAPKAARAFVSDTFACIESGKLHAIAAAFTYGREDLIPDIFRGLVRDFDTQFHGRYRRLLWYLERHIEVDGEDHGPLARRMVADLCGDDAERWQEAITAAESALASRLRLWDGIVAALGTR